MKALVIKDLYSYCTLLLSTNALFQIEMKWTEMQTAFNSLNFN